MICLQHFIEAQIFKFWPDYILSPLLITLMISTESIMVTFYGDQLLFLQLTMLAQCGSLVVKLISTNWKIYNCKWRVILWKPPVTLRELRFMVIWVGSLYLQFKILSGWNISRELLIWTCIAGQNCCLTLWWVWTSIQVNCATNLLTAPRTFWTIATFMTSLIVLRLAKTQRIHTGLIQLNVSLTTFL